MEVSEKGMESSLFIFHVDVLTYIRLEFAHHIGTHVLSHQHVNSTDYTAVYYIPEDMHMVSCVLVAVSACMASYN